MCAIAGLITKAGNPPNEAHVRQMTTALAHRGPDGEGIWTLGGVSFGHRRLAIIDLSEAGHQPMHTKDGRLSVTYNGEIYNYLELRTALEKKGAQFRSQSDTEVILEAYRVWGAKCVKKFRGMFAFALFDHEKNVVMMARDPMGKKPLFYRTLKDGTLAFASEIKALLPLEPAPIDDGAIRLFLGLQYVPAPLTGFKGIVSLSPASIAMVKDGKITLSTYHTWELPEHTLTREEDIDATLVRLLEESVALRLRSDVPVAAFLSGGIDSAAITALAMKHLKGAAPMKTFTMGFPSLGLDERKQARALAHALGTEHHEFEAAPQDLLAMAEAVVRQYDAPYADSSALPLMLVAEQAAKEAKVVLAGDGGDELFGGYKRYVAFERALRIGRMPAARTWATPLLRIIAKLRRDTRFRRMADTVGANVGTDGQNRAYAELFCGAYVSSALALELCTPNVLAQMGSDPIAFIADKMGETGDPLSRAMRFDLVSYLADDLNVKMDRATMAHGLEARCPFLDKELAAFALQLPLNEKVKRGNTKVALRRALRQALPAEVVRTGVLERGKQGFQLPLAEWFRGPLAESWRNRCLDPNGPLTKFVRIDVAKQLYDAHQGGHDHGNRLWMLYALAIWAEGK